MSSSAVFLTKIKVAMAAGVVLMVMVGSASYFAIQRLIETAQSRVRTEDTLVVVERVVSGIKTAEASLRQYLLSGNPADHADFDKALADLGSTTARARSANPIPELVELDELIARRTAVARQAIAARQETGQAAAAAILGSGGSRQSRQRTDELLEAARSREGKTWGDAQAMAERSAQWAQGFIIAGNLLFFAMLAWVVYVVKHYEEVRKRGEAQLRDSEAMSRSITEGMAEAVITTRSDDIVLEANAAALQLFGYERGELVGRDVSELVPERLRRQYKEFTAAMRARPGPFRIAGREVLAQRKDGGEFRISVSFGDVHVGGRRLFTALMHDITESTRISEALRASESQLRQVTDTVPALIAYLDPADGRQADAVLVKAHTSNSELLHTIQRVLQIPGDPGPTRPQALS